MGFVGFVGFLCSHVKRGPLSGKDVEEGMHGYKNENALGKPFPRNKGRKWAGINAVRAPRMLSGNSVNTLTRRGQKLEGGIKKVWRIGIG